MTPITALFTAGFALLCGWPALAETPAYLLLNSAGAVAFVTVGMSLKREFEKRLLGSCLIVAGLFWAARWMTTWNVGPLPYIGSFCEIGFYGTAGVGIISYVRNSVSRRVSVTLLTLLALLPVERLLLFHSFAQPEWIGFRSDVWWPAFDVTPRAFDIAAYVVYFYEVFVASVFVLVLLLSIGRARGIERRFLVPIGIAFAFAAQFSSLAQTSAELGPGPTFTFKYFVVSLTTSIIPIGIAIGLLRRFLQTATVSRSIHASFANRAFTSAEVEGALRATLNDPTLRLLFFDKRTSTFLDSSGLTAIPVDSSASRSIFGDDGQVSAVVEAHPSLARHGVVLDAAVDASRVALENARLQAVVKSQLEEVRRSRARIAEAAIEERQRIERDLHDGIQQRLLALSARIGATRERTSDESTALALYGLSAELQSTLDELRSLARGIHPSELRQFGLSAALGEVATALPLDVDLQVTESRFDSAIETTAYFVVCEALANAVKHADTRSVSVVIMPAEGHLRIRIADAGVGGADFSAGTGLTGMYDRVAATNGSLTISSNPGQGTEIAAILPLDAPNSDEVEQ